MDEKMANETIIMMRHAFKAREEEKRWRRFLLSNEKIISFYEVAAPFTREYADKIVETKMESASVIFDAIKRELFVIDDFIQFVLLTKEKKDKYKMVYLTQENEKPVVYIF